MNYILFLNAFRQKYKGITDQHLLLQYLREELQYLILYIIYTKTTYPLYFMGGTKLRLSYGINRFSEDIDFALDKPDPNFPVQNFFADLQKAFSEKVTGFKLNSTMSDKRNVVKIMLSFGQMLFDLKLSPLKDQTIKIKIEIDINPPKGAQYETITYRSFAGDFLINTYNLSTGLSGKISAILGREYQKGRDYYDLQWYLQQRSNVSINLPYLNASCAQQNQQKFRNTAEVIKMLNNKVKKVDITLLRLDLERFVVMDAQTFKKWLDNYIPETISLLEIYQKNYENR